MAYPWLDKTPASARVSAVSKPRGSGSNITPLFLCTQESTRNYTRSSARAQIETGRNGEKHTSQRRSMRPNLLNECQQHGVVRVEPTILVWKITEVHPPVYFTFLILLGESAVETAYGVMRRLLPTNKQAKVSEYKGGNITDDSVDEA